MMRWFILGVVLSLLGCADRRSPTMISGTTTRISTEGDEVPQALEVKLAENRYDCIEITSGNQNGYFDPEEFTDAEAQYNACLPYLNRATGEISISFGIAVSGGGIAKLPLEVTNMELLHDGDGKLRPISKDEKNGINVELLRHDPTSSGQLFIILIDHSSSMMDMASSRKNPAVEKSRMEWVRDALLQSADVFVQKSREEKGRTLAPSAAALFRFYGPSNGGKLRLEGLNNKSWKKVKPVTSKSTFKKLVSGMGKDRSKMGWTHLYSAVDLATGDLLKKGSAVHDYLEKHAREGISPTVILLTDGFNNTEGSQNCASNAPKLERVLKDIKKARKVATTHLQPTLFTVGFGRPLVGFKTDTGSTSVDPVQLCGGDGDLPINNGLEKKFIDGVSLRRMAYLGGGKAFLGSDPSRLRSHFKKTAPPRYRWYTYRYRLPPSSLRSRFSTTVRLKTSVNAQSTMTWFPSPWLDAPPGEALLAFGDSAATSNGQPADPATPGPAALRYATSLLLLILGILMCISFLGPAWFNGRRAVMRRSKKTS